MSFETIKYIEQTQLNDANKQFLIKQIFDTLDIKTAFDIINICDVLLKYYDYISMDTKQYLFTYILFKYRIKKNSSMHKLIENLLIDCDMTKNIDTYSSPIKQIFTQYPYMFDIFHAKYNNILDITDDQGNNFMTFFKENIIFNELLSHILNKFPNVDYKKLLEYKQTIYESIIHKYIVDRFLTQTTNENYDTLLIQHNELLAKHNEVQNKLTETENKLNQTTDKLNKIITFVNDNLN